MRMGGLLTIPAMRASPGTSEGTTARMFGRLFAAALRDVSSSARVLVSTAHTVRPGNNWARTSAMGPAPQPRSMRSPSGRSTRTSAIRSRSRAVALSSEPWLNTPLSDSTEMGERGPSIVYLMTLEVTEGSASK